MRPVAAQRTAIAPPRQRFTFLATVFTLPVRFSIGFVEHSVRPSAPRDPEPNERQRLLHPLTDRSGGPGMAVFELVGQVSASVGPS